MKLTKKAIHEYKLTKFFSFNAFSCCSQHEAVAAFFASDGVGKDEVATLLKIHLPIDTTPELMSQFINPQKLSKHDE
jgi:hypothetical protein